MKPQYKFSTGITLKSVSYLLVVLPLASIGSFVLSSTLWQDNPVSDADISFMRNMFEPSHYTFWVHKRPKLFENTKRLFEFYQKGFSLI